MKDVFFAILDVGKTNKKVLIYDTSLQMVDQKSRRFDEKVEGNLRLDDVEGVMEWFIETLRSFAEIYPIDVISVTTHGATFVLIDEEGNIAVPEISYTTEPGEDFHKEFYEKFGTSIELQQKTCTPELSALVNTAKGIYFSQKKYPEKFKNARYLLNFPQYFTYQLCKKACYEPTYVGNHSYLWDFDSNQWSFLTDALGIRHLLPNDFMYNWQTAGNLTEEMARKTGLSSAVKITPGIHDSNSSLLPYLLTQKEDFILNSTGTWCVIMRERDKAILKAHELGKVVFFNLNAFLKPLKTAIFLGGFEFDQYQRIFESIHGKHEIPPFDAELATKIIAEKKLFILPSIATGTGQFPNAEAMVIEEEKSWKYHDLLNGKDDIPKFFKDLKTAYTVLNLSLAAQTYVAFERADMTDGMPVFTEGGFSKNDSYNALMTAFYPNSSFYLTNLQEATAYGAAMCALACHNQESLNDISEKVVLEKTPVDTYRNDDIHHYMNRFTNLLGK
jgi:L-fuculokinase